MVDLAVIPTRPADFQFTVPKSLDGQKIPTSLMPGGEADIFISKKARIYSSLSTIGSILLSPLMAIARLINAIAQSTMKKRPEGTPAPEKMDGFGQFVHHMTKFEQSNLTDHNSVEQAARELFDKLEMLPIPESEKEACRAYIHKQIDLLTFGMVDAQEAGTPQVTFGSVNQFTSDPSSLACTFCASIWLANFLDPDLPATLSPESINEVILNGTRAYKLSGVRDMTEFAQIQPILEDLGVGRLPLEEVDYKYNEYFDREFEIGVESPAEDYLTLIEHHLDESGKGAVLTMNGGTFAIAKRDNRWYMFDSHGGNFPSKAAFVASFENPRQLALFLAQTYQPRNTQVLALVDAGAKIIHEMEDKNPQVIQNFLIELVPKAAGFRTTFCLDAFSNPDNLDSQQNIRHNMLLVASMFNMEPVINEYAVNKIPITPVKFQRAVNAK